MKKNIKLISLDLDGTLLDSHKRLSERNRRALEYAAGKGVEIAAATGRFCDEIPNDVGRLSFIKYVIESNGANVLNRFTKESVYKSEIPYEKAVDLMRMADNYPVAYDCSIDGFSWITKDFITRAETFAPDRFYLELFKKMKNPVPELKTYVLKRKRDVQKVQWFTLDMESRDRFIKDISDRFPDVSISYAVPRNIEINSSGANKGRALEALACHLKLFGENVMSFGDSLNDKTMIIYAGTGVAMGNATDDLKAAADLIAPTNDEDGVAEIIEKYL